MAGDRYDWPRVRDWMHDLHVSFHDELPGGSGTDAPMDIDTYAVFTRSTAVYPSEHAHTYVTLGLANEAGEVAGAIKKYLRGDYGEAELRDRMLGELGDVAYYWARCCEEFGFTPSEVLEHNVEKLTKRQQEGKLKGDGDTR